MTAAVGSGTPVAFRSVNPTTEETLAEFVALDEAAIEAGLARAEAGFRRWRSVSTEQRAGFLSGLASVLRRRADELATLAVREMGKPLHEARAEIEKCAFTCDFYSEHGPRFLADEPVQTAALDSYVAYRPLGVVLAIMPWNFPYWQCVRHLAPALVAGNAVILKPAENTVGCAQSLQQVCDEAGLPRGVFQSLLIDREHMPAVISDRRVAAVTLTGSARAGAAVAAAAGAALKKSVLELGGSDPFVVLADADLDAAATAAVQSRFLNAGQTCIAAKRIIAVEPIADALLARIVDRVGALRIDDPLLDGTDLGPLAREDLRVNLERQVEASLAAGAGIALEGGRMERRGWFFSPVVLTGAGPDTPVVCEETFGPVAVVLRAPDTDAAIAVANDTVYGLGADLWTADLERGRELAVSLEAGSVFINGKTLSDPPLPFGGVKNSGYGRELSSWGIREFVNVQAVSVNGANPGGGDGESSVE
jgi:succinate-semialdehyde dehydrogenase/glutarate-semialdehyde dehydrogenase